MSQTGGGCRASNYIGIYPPCIKEGRIWHRSRLSPSILSGLESEPRIQAYSCTGNASSLRVLLFGDIFMKCVYRMRPYEQEARNRKQKYIRNGEQRMQSPSVKRICSFSHSQFKKMCREMIHEFDTIPITDMKKPRVGIVGEILVKFLPAANNHLAELLESEGAEAVVPDLIDFMLLLLLQPEFQG